MKKLTGTTSGTTGNSVAIPHGLNISKIISVNVLVNYNNTLVSPNYTKLGFLDLLYFVSVESNNINIELDAGAINITNQPIRILITYEE